MRLKRTAIQFSEAGSRERQPDTRPIIVIPHIPLTELLEKHLCQHLRIAIRYPLTDEDWRNDQSLSRPTHPKARILYKVPCGDASCHKAYCGKSSRELETRLGEQIRTLELLELY